MNNYEYLKTLSITDFAKGIYEKISDDYRCGFCIHDKKCTVRHSCLKGIKDWLKSEVKNEQF